MGFFSNLFGKVKKMTDTSDKQSPKVQPKAKNEPQQKPVATFKDKLREIFATEYPQYEVQANVDIKKLDPSQEFGGPIDFVLLSDGKIVGAVILIDKGKKRTKRVYGVELACKNTGVGFANFYPHFNESKDFPFSREHAVAYLKRQIR